MSKAQAASVLLSQFNRELEKMAYDIIDPITGAAKGIAKANLAAAGFMGLNKRRALQAAGAAYGAGLRPTGVNLRGPGESIAGMLQGATAGGTVSGQAGNVLGSEVAERLMKNVHNPLARIAGKFVAGRLGSKLTKGVEDYGRGKY
jgi:hypothetical protein